MSAVIDDLRACGVEAYTREQWGSPREADGSYAKRRGTHPMPSDPAPYHYLHISVTADTDTVQEGAAGARQVETYGYSTPPMVSYQDLVTNEGRYFEGQSYGVKGTHTVNDRKLSGFPRDLNLLGYATALLQNVWDEVTDEQVRTVAIVFASRELHGLVRRGAPVYPHRKFAEKACPGDNAMARIEEIERLKNRYVRNGLPKENEDMGYKDWPKADREQLVSDVAKAVTRELLGHQLKVRTADGRKRITLRQAVARAGSALSVVHDKTDRILDEIDRDNEGEQQA